MNCGGSVGRLPISANSWLLADVSGLGTGFSANGVAGRVLIRIHCANLLDAQKKVFSAGLDQIVGTTALRLPGGSSKAGSSSPQARADGSGAGAVLS
jgi:hypothetical protein